MNRKIRRITCAAVSMIIMTLVPLNSFANEAEAYADEDFEIETSESAMDELLSEGDIAAYDAELLSEEDIAAYDAELLSEEDIAAYDAEPFSAEDDGYIARDYAAESYSRGDIVNFGHRPYGTDYFVPDKVNSQLKGAEMGQYLIDGFSYYSDGSTVYGTFPLRWIVVDVQGDSLVLMAEYVFTAKAFSNSINGDEVAWSSSKLREYVNSDSYADTHFLEDEKAAILTTNVTADGEETLDRFYIPSYEELTTWFEDSSSRRAYYYDMYTPNITTPITGSSTALAYDKTNYTCAYWTRSSNHEHYTFAQPTYVDCNGEIRWGGRVYNTWNLAVRPVVRVDASSPYVTRAISNLPAASDGTVVQTEGIETNAFSDAFLQLPYSKYGSYSSYDSSGTYSVMVPRKYSLGKTAITTYVYGFGAERETSAASVITLPITESISAEGTTEGITLTWRRPCDWSLSNGRYGYEILRSDGENGEYEVIYRGAVSNMVEDDELVFDYLDDSVEVGIRHYYKVRGLMPDQNSADGDGRSVSIDGYSGEFSNIAYAERLELVPEEGSNITYVLNGGINNPGNPSIVASGTSFVYLNPTRPGYAFAGWFSDVKMKQRTVGIVASQGYDVTIYAKWTANKYMVNYDGNGNTGGKTAATTLTYDKASKLAKCGFKRNGYMFYEWNTKEDGSGDSYKAGEAGIHNLSDTEEAATLYAIWKPIGYVVCFKAPDKTQSMAEITAAYDVPFEIPDSTFVKPGYYFSSWNTKGSGKGVTYHPGDEAVNLTSKNKVKVTLYPVWQYDVVFDGNGGEGDMPMRTLFYKTAAKLPENRYTRTGYVFSGWKAEVNGKNRSFKNKASIKNLVNTSGNPVCLVAQWKPVKYSVEFNPNTGDAKYDKASKNIIRVKNLAYDVTYRIPACAAQKQGYVFTCWNTKPDGSGDSVNPGDELSGLSDMPATVKYYAIWKPAGDSGASE